MNPVVEDVVCVGYDVVLKIQGNKEGYLVVFTGPLEDLTLVINVTVSI